MMQVVDLAHPQLHEKVSRIDRIFISPEVMNNTAPELITGKADVWSLGVILYLLISGGLPDNNSD